MMITWDAIAIELIYFVRLLLAAVCGGLIGLEREKRQKSAGLRTHIIVAMTSALMMIVSKYGFFDILNVPGLSVDVSRIAAGVVSAIGFLGAGVIFIRRDNAVGLTTAAGLWATVGVGIAAGAGMYVLTISTTVVLLLIQYVMHTKKLNFVSSAAGTVVINMTKHNFSYDGLKVMLEEKGIFIRNVSFTYDDQRNLIMRATIMLAKREPVSQLIKEMDAFGYIDAMDVYTLN